MSIKITSPIEGYDGKSVFGPTTVTFTGGVAEIDELGAPLRAYLESRGYVLEDVEVGPFDPTGHTAPEVLAFLGLTEGHEPPTAEEYDRVVAAERAGKARKGVLDVVEKAEADPAAAALNAQTQGGGAA